MPWQSQVVYAQQVIVYGSSGTVSGMFVYNGTPGLGNPPIFSITENSVDPYGNVIPPAVQISGIPFFIYDGPPALGNLIYSNVPGAAGTDIYGNDYLAGETTYANTGTGSFTYAAQNLGGVIQLYGNGPAVGNYAVAWLKSPDPGFIQLNSGTTGSGDTETVLEVQSADNGGFATLVSGSDANVYQFGYQVALVTAEQQISSESGAVITDLEFEIGEGVTYYYRANMVVKGLAANDAYLYMGGGATFSTFRAGITWVGSGQNLLIQQTTFNNDTGLNSNALVDGDFYDCVLEGYGVCTASGTFAPFGAASANATSYGVLAGSTMLLYPVNPSAGN